jgi:transposase
MLIKIVIVAVLISFICVVMCLFWMMKTKRRRSHNFRKKMQCILRKREDSTLGYGKLAKEFNVGKSTVQGWLQDGIEEDFQVLGKDRKRKRMRLSANPVLDIALLEYYDSFRQHNPSETIDIDTLMVWSIAIAEIVKCDSFTHSGLKTFKRRHGIKLKRRYGSAAAADAEAAENWILYDLPKIRANYPDNRIYNVDQSSLFWRALQNRSLAFKSDLLIGGGCSKKRLTFQLCVTPTGVKRRMLIIGHSANP